MSVHRDPNGIYQYRFMYKGKIVKRSTRQGNYRVACDMENEHRSKLAKGEAGLGDTDPVPTLAEFLTKRVRPWSEKKPKQTTRTWYRSGITPLLAYKPIVSRALDALTSEHIDDYAAHRQSQNRVAGTINRELRVLRRCLRLAVKWGVIDTAPKVDMLPCDDRRERVVKDDEFAKYLAHATPLLADVATVLHDTGLRPEECHRAMWSDVNFVGDERAPFGWLHVRRGKTKAARRRMPMSRSVREVLEARHRMAGQPQTGYVFPAPTRSGHIEHGTLKKPHRKALAGSKVIPFLLISLRHSFATRLATHPRMDAFTLCRIMGWSSISIAMTYVHTDDEKVLDVFGGCTEFLPTENAGKFSEVAESGKVVEGETGYLVSAAGFEPATHALKGHCSTN